MHFRKDAVLGNTMLRIWNQIAKLSIFVRLTLGYLTIMSLVIGVNWFILNQLRTLSELGTELVSYHYPTVETGKRLITSLLVQLKEPLPFRLHSRWKAAQQEPEALHIGDGRNRETESAAIRGFIFTNF